MYYIYFRFNGIHSIKLRRLLLRDNNLTNQLCVHVLPGRGDGHLYVHVYDCLPLYGYAKSCLCMRTAKARVIGYYRIFQWRAKGWIFAHVQDDVNLRIFAWSKALFRLRQPTRWGIHLIQCFTTLLLSVHLFAIYSPAIILKCLSDLYIHGRQRLRTWSGASLFSDSGRL